MTEIFRGIAAFLFISVTWLYLAVTENTGWTALGSVLVALIAASSSYLIAVRRGRSSEASALFKAGQQLRHELRNEVLDLRRELKEYEAREDELRQTVRSLRVKESELEDRIMLLERENARQAHRIEELEVRHGSGPD